jgi:hypothetical protein
VSKASRREKGGGEVSYRDEREPIATNRAKNRNQFTFGTGTVPASPCDMGGVCPTSVVAGHSMVGIAVSRRPAHSMGRQVRPVTGEKTPHGVHRFDGAQLVDGLNRHHWDVFVVG